MKKTMRVSLIGLWVLFATWLLTRWWLTHPDEFPHIPESWALWLVNLLYDTQNEIVDVELLVSFVLSFVIVSLLTLVGWFLWRRVKKR